MSLSLITPPTLEPVSLSQAKAHLRVDHEDEDGLIERLIVAARKWIEHQTALALLSSTWRITLDRFPAGEIILPRRPVGSVTSIVSEGETVNTAVYKVDGRRVTPVDNWPSVNTVQPNAVQVNFTAGWSTPDDVPQDLTVCLLLLLGIWYRQREGVVIGTISGELPLGVQALLSSWLDHDSRSEPMYSGAEDDLLRRGM